MTQKIQTGDLVLFNSDKKPLRLQNLSAHSGSMGVIIDSIQGIPAYMISFGHGEVFVVRETLLEKVS